MSDLLLSAQIFVTWLVAAVVVTQQYLTHDESFYKIIKSSNLQEVFHLPAEKTFLRYIS